MKRRKTFRYLIVILSLIALSVGSPLVIRAVSGYIAGKIRGQETAETMADTEEVLREGDSQQQTTELTVGSEEEPESGYQSQLRPGSGHGQIRANSGDGVDHDRNGEQTIVEENSYEEPMYRSREEEAAANRRAWQDMTEKLLSMSEAAAAYRKNFNPVYDELKSGLMNAFVSGREQIFYEDIADYCFGHYNTTQTISMVRFDALVEDTQEKMTVIIEFFTAEDLLEETGIPDLAYCTYNKKTEAFVFFTNAVR